LISTPDITKWLANVCLSVSRFAPFIPFQGVLTDTAGNPLTGNFSIRFSIWTLPVGGTEKWNETQPAVSVTDGLFNVQLGSVNEIDDSVLFQTASRYLEIKVGADPPLSPRQRLASAPYAFSLENEPGLAYAMSSLSSFPLPSADTTILSRIISTQTDGYVIVTASGYFRIDPAAAGNKAAARASISTIFNSVDFDNLVIWGAPDWPSASTEYYSSWSITRVFTVGAGSHTYYLTADKYLGASDQVEMGRPSLTLLFIPESKGIVGAVAAQGGADINTESSALGPNVGPSIPTNLPDRPHVPEEEEQ
jgi:hypothetical protein